VSIENDEMTVYNDAGDIILTFSRVEALPLEGTLWELATYNNGQNAMVSVLPDTFVTAKFEDEQVSGSAGCNSYFGAYETSGDMIQIGPLASTMMACADPVNEQEQLYLVALESVATFQIIANRLELISEEGALAAMYQAVEPVELPGTNWDVISYNNGRGGVTSVIIGTELTVNFDEETVAGLAGCNNYNGGYEVDGQAINFGPLATTRKFCPDPEGTMDQESEFLAALENAARYEIEGDRMDMYFEDGARAMTLERMK
jgi:heat shock protein HslJ